MSQFGYSNGANSALNNYIDIQLYRQLLRDGYPVERALEIAAYQNSPQGEQFSSTLCRMNLLTPISKYKQRGSS